MNDDADSPVMTVFDAAMIMDGAWDLTNFEPSEENYVSAAQFLIDNGVAWQLQGSVGRACTHLVEQELCTLPERSA